MAVTVVTALLIVLLAGTDAAVAPAYAGMALAFAIQVTNFNQKHALVQLLSDFTIQWVLTFYGFLLSTICSIFYLQHFLSWHKVIFVQCFPVPIECFLLKMSGIFQFSVRMHTELEAKLPSVERMNYYIEVN